MAAQIDDYLIASAPSRRSGRRFEVDSADEARRFLQGHGVPEDSVRRVWTAIALYTTPGIPEFMEPEVALVTAGVEYDVLGIGYHDISDTDRRRHKAAPAAGLQAPHPARVHRGHRAQAGHHVVIGNVKADVLDRFVPGYQRGNFADVVENSDWPE